MSAAKGERRPNYAYSVEIPTRWMDCDAYGHVNNVVYYSWFDTAVNRWLIERGLLDPVASPAIGLVVETRCRYFAPVSFPEPVDVALSVAHLGRSSVRYAIGLFRPGEDAAAALGEFTHVYVDRSSRRPVEIPDPVREALSGLKS